MPRFLNTYTGEFEWHDNPARVRYAILSHTWRSAADGGEQSLEDVKKLQSASFVPAQRHEISQACLVARMNGFQLIWIDSCCIDKASSAELSEAINSMYELYRLSGACYVYLADVPDDDHPQALGSSFRFSRWRKRGWTLQELIAPERVIFLTSTWRFLGTRLGLATTLADITTISVDILVGHASVASISVAQRMSWASLRETTRVEDRAYSLLGIFGVHLSPIYGEGDNAFRRLQEEIIKTIPDQSIFAW
ncbi:HET-domain-containing protein, partial [Trametes versicolor FP-101664 SS1]